MHMCNTHKEITYLRHSPLYTALRVCLVSVHALTEVIHDLGAMGSPTSPNTHAVLFPKKDSTNWTPSLLLSTNMSRNADCICAAFINLGAGQGTISCHSIRAQTRYPQILSSLRRSPKPG